MTYDAFVSYSHDDRAWVSDFVKRLEAQGVSIALDDVFVQPGDILVHAVEQAIRDSAHGILVFSRSSVASGWVLQEYSALMRRSIEDGRRFIPVRIDDADLPEFAATRLAVDFTKLSAPEYDHAVTKIAAALRS